MPPDAQTPQVSKYKKRKIRELLGLSDAEVGADARNLGLTKAQWYADSAAQYNAEVRAEQRERAAKLNEKRRAAVASRTRSQTHAQQQQQQQQQQQFNNDDEAGPSSGHRHFRIGDFYWNHSATKQLMTSSERGATKLCEYSFMKTMPILEDVYRKYPPYDGKTMFDDEVQALRLQLYIGSMLSTISSRSFMASIRKQITESIPYRVSLKFFAMFGQFVGKEKKIRCF
jgi:hypothetical protein